MKKKTINYTSPDIKEVDVRVRSVIATSVWGTAERMDYDQGYNDEGYGNEGYNYDEGKW